MSIDPGFPLPHVYFTPFAWSKLLYIDECHINFHCIITKKENLNRNILNIEYRYLSTSREVRSNKFQHTVGLKLLVKTANLWEGPRSYIWKHIGQETWSRGNGTLINLVRIHHTSISLVFLGDFPISRPICLLYTYV